MKAKIFDTLPNCDKNGITEEINLIYRQYRSRGIPWNRCSKEFYKFTNSYVGALTMEV